MTEIPFDGDPGGGYTARPKGLASSARPRSRCGLCRPCFKPRPGRLGGAIN